MQLGDASSVLLRMNGLKGRGLVRVTSLGHGPEHVNTLELGLSELYEIGFWADVLSFPFDFKRHIDTRLGTGHAHVNLANITVLIMLLTYQCVYFIFQRLALIICIYYYLAKSNNLQRAEN